MLLFILPLLFFSLLFCCLRDHGVSGVGTERLSVMEGESITLNTGVKTNQQEDIRWYFTLVNDILIAEITGDQSKICKDVQCKERFRDRLKLDLETGSLTITNTRPTDSGVYKLKLNSSKISAKILIVTVHSFFSHDTNEESAFVMEGDSVTLHTETNQQKKIKWYFNGIRLAQITGDLSDVCTDVQCNEGNERFRDRLKLDHQTGSLTIMNITNTHSGLYQLQIINSGKLTEDSFSVSVSGVSAAERDEVKRKSVKEGESVTLNPGVIKNPNALILWYFNGILIAEITGDQSKICTDVQCKERFTDRLKLDHQTGSLTITNTRNTDSGEYQLQMTTNSSSIGRKLPALTVIAVPDSGSSPGVIAGICVAVALLVAAAVSAVIYYRKCQGRSKIVQTGSRRKLIVHQVLCINRPDKPSVTAANETSQDENENVAASEN